ncbi:MAG: Gfo/Idh/MocA family oxidoreductase [Betaproteobacteria bacterium]
MIQQIRYGIIGCGAMGREHIENIRALTGTNITAIADPHPPSRESAQALLETPAHAFEHHRDLLASGLCDAVVIATPNFTHIAILRDALATDLHILVEKPLCTTIEDGIEIMQRAQGRRGLAWVGQEYRYMPPVAELVRMTHAGDVGRVHQVGIREHRQPFYPKVDNWNRFSANTGGTLVEKCCHYFNMMDLILREKPIRVFASGAQRVNHLDERYDGRTPDILDSAYVIVEYASGARAMLDLCMFAENSIDKEHIVVVGDQGKIETMLPSLTLRYGRRDDCKREAWGDGEKSGDGVMVRRVWDASIKYSGQHFGASFVEHRHFATAIRNGQPAEVTLEEGLRCVATGLAAHRSIDTGRMVALAEVLPTGW